MKNDFKRFENKRNEVIKDFKRLIVDFYEIECKPSYEQIRDCIMSIVDLFNKNRNVMLIIRD
jgi:hypothetical protein